MATVTSGSIQLDTKVAVSGASYTVPAGRYAILQYYAYNSEAVKNAYTVSVALYIDGVIVNTNTISGNTGGAFITVTAEIYGGSLYAGPGAVITTSGDGLSLSGVLFKNS
jgi:hypothetical protein